MVITDDLHLVPFAFAVRFAFDRYDVILAIGSKAWIITVSMSICQVKHLDPIACIEIVHATIVNATIVRVA